MFHFFGVLCAPANCLRNNCHANDVIIIAVSIPFCNSSHQEEYQKARQNPHGLRPCPAITSAQNKNIRLWAVISTQEIGAVKHRQHKQCQNAVGYGFFQWNFHRFPFLFVTRDNRRLRSLPPQRERSLRPPPHRPDRFHPPGPHNTPAERRISGGNAPLGVPGHHNHRIDTIPGDIDGERRCILPVPTVNGCPIRRFDFQVHFTLHRLKPNLKHILHFSPPCFKQKFQSSLNILQEIPVDG